MLRLYKYLNSNNLEVVVESDFRSNSLAIQEETVVGAIETMVIAGETKAESSSELLGSCPSNARTEAHSITVSVNQTEITCQIHEQGELLSDGATHVADVRLKAQHVSGVGDFFTKDLDLVLSEAVACTQGYRPLVVDVVANFRGDGEVGVVIVNRCTNTTTDPYLSVSGENACKGKS